MRSRPSSLWTHWAAALRPFIVSLSLLAATTGVAQAATLSGRLVDPEGRAVTNAQVVVTSGLGAVAEMRSGPSGEFEFRQLPDGRYDVRVVLEGFQAAPETVTLAGEDRRELTIRLAIGAVRESIVVSASQVETPRSTTPASVTVINGTDLRALQVESVADALRQVPGLSVSRSGGRGAITSLFPRGGASNYTLVLVDGIRANSFGGAYDFAHLSVANVDRVEIVRGPQSALYGSEAIGAVVQVITSRGGPAHVDGLIEGGNQGTLRATAGTSASHGGWSWGFGAERAQSDGFTGTTESGEQVSNDDYTRNLATGTLCVPAAPELGRADCRHVGERRPRISRPVGPIPSAPSRASTESRVAPTTRAGWSRVTHPWSESFRQRAEASYYDLSSDFTSSFGPSSSGTKRFDGRVQEDILISSILSASGGVEFVGEQGRSTYMTGAAGTENPDSTQRRWPVRRGAAGGERTIERQRRRASGASRTRRGRARPIRLPTPSGIRRADSEFGESQDCGVVLPLSTRSVLRHPSQSECRNRHPPAGRF